MQQAGVAADGAGGGARPSRRWSSTACARVYDDRLARWCRSSPTSSFTLEAGKIVSIVGPSGCGKTTLLNVLSGLIAADGGSISWYGQPLPGMPPQRRLHAAEGPPVPLAHGARQRDAGPRDHAVSPRARRTAAAACAAGPAGPARLRRSLPGHAVRRHAAARGAGPHAGQRARRCCCSTSRSRRWTSRPSW